MLACNNIMHDALNATGHVWVPAMIGQMSALQQPSGPFSIWGHRMTSCCASVDTSGSDTAVSVSVCVCLTTMLWKMSFCHYWSISVMCFTARVMLILRGGSIHYVNGFKSKSKERMQWWQWGPNTWVNCDGMAIILTLLVHLSHLFQCIAIFSTNYLDYWLRKLTRKLTKLAPKLINGLWPLWRNKKPENKKKTFIMLFVYFWGVLQNQDEHF